jgi:dipeptidyl aminopeptidase/acylaminoacyl peptidase
MVCRLFLFIFLFGFFQSAIYSISPLLDEEERDQESLKIMERSLKIAKFYELPEGLDIKEITDDLLNSSLVPEVRKQAIRAFGRRTFVFIYPSDGLQVKGVVSFVPNSDEFKTAIFLRGGNRIFGILNPASDFMCADHYTILSTMYRGGVSEGEDGFGGQDVNDVNNLIEFIPQLEQKLNITIQNEKMFLIGGSRGGMQMFLTLTRFPALQTRFTKIVSLSGLLDMHQTLLTRPDMKKMFIKRFGLIEGVNEEEWVNERNPLLVADKINPDLPILIIQGTLDNRIDLEEGYHMVAHLQDLGKNVTYWEIEGGEHCLNNVEDRVERVFNWLEE